MSEVLKFLGHGLLGLLGVLGLVVLDEFEQLLLVGAPLHLGSVRLFHLLLFAGGEQQTA